MSSSGHSNYDMEHSSDDVYKSWSFSSFGGGGVNFASGDCVSFPVSNCKSAQKKNH